MNGLVRSVTLVMLRVVSVQMSSSKERNLLASAQSSLDLSTFNSSLPFFFSPLPHFTRTHLHNMSAAAAPETCTLPLYHSHSRFQNSSTDPVFVSSSNSWLPGRDQYALSLLLFANQVTSCTNSLPSSLNSPALGLDHQCVPSHLTFRHASTDFLAPLSSLLSFSCARRCSDTFYSNKEVRCFL